MPFYVIKLHKSPVTIISRSGLASAKSLLYKTNQPLESVHHLEDAFAQLPMLESGFSHPLEELSKIKLDQPQPDIQPPMGEENLKTNGNIDSMGLLYVVTVIAYRLVG
jgi:hypothetical protein